MSSVDGAARKLTRAVGRAATITTEAAGAVGGAAVNGVVGGVKGAASGVQQGLSSGSHSTPLAALTLGALGVAGLVEWPVLAAVGGAALLLRQLNKRSTANSAPVRAVPTASVKPAGAGTPAKSAGARRSPQKKQTPAPRSRGNRPRAHQ